MLACNIKDGLQTFHNDITSSHVSKESICSPTGIIWVDDDPLFLEMAKLFLKKGGNIKLDTTTDPNKVPMQIATGQYKVLITDLWMPGLAGRDLIELVRKNTINLLIIVVSLIEDPNEINSLKEQFSVYYFKKNSDIPQLFSNITELLFYDSLTII